MEASFLAIENNVCLDIHHYTDYCTNTFRSS
jgi:hypothetical protein